MDLQSINSFYNQKRKPKDGDYRVQRIKNTNLYLLKTSDGSRGILLSKIFSKPKFSYKNFKTTYKNNFEIKDKSKIISGCFMIIANEEIDSKLFQDILYKYLVEKSEKIFFRTKDIKELFDKLSMITKRKEKKRIEAIVGASGELHFILELINNVNEDAIKRNIIKSWESENSRSIIDFSFNRSKIKIEVKSTLLNNRYHHINDIKQLQCRQNDRGFLLSNCFMESKNGRTNSDLVNEIKESLGIEAISTLENKIDLRGKECLDDKLKLQINENLMPKLYNFDSVPVPIGNEFIDQLTWYVYLDEIEPLSQSDYINILNLITK